MKYRRAPVLTSILAVLAVIFVAIFLYAHQRTVVAVSGDGDLDDNADVVAAYTAAALQAMQAPKIRYRISSSTPQFVLLSFDGSKSLDMLNETLAFEKDMRAGGTPIDLTYFINAVYFLTKDNAGLYLPPGQPAGTSMIGYSSTTQDIAMRVGAFNKAWADGNEIGSHSVGHFNGAAWSYDQWNQEFGYFTSLLASVQRNNPTQSIDAPAFLSSIHGFRAPQLGVNDSLYKLLGDLHFAYDASGVAATDSWPYKDIHGIWRIPLGTVHLGANPSPVVAMDYNVWTRQSGAKEVAVRGSQLWTDYFNEVEKAYMDYFNADYNGNRGPVVIADHFSKWNDGVYWEAMKAFAQNVCGKPQVRCVTFGRLVDYLNTTGVPPIER